MSGPAKSIIAHGIYLAFLGILLIAVPNLPLRLLGIPDATDGWVRITGALVFLLGFYYIQAARKETIEFMRWTVYGRTGFMLFCIMFVGLGLAAPGLLMAGLVDLLGAIWTALALRKFARLT